MKDVRLTATAVRIAYQTSTGLRSIMNIRGGDRVKSVSGEPCSAQQALLDSIDELTRLAELDGCGSAVVKTVAAARLRTQKWLKENSMNLAAG